jgi:hypothetical protein
MTKLRFLFGVLAMSLLLATGAQAAPESWTRAWPETDFANHTVPLEEIRSGGVPKDGIPPIDEPVFAPVDAARGDLESTEPVVSVSIGGEWKAYPLRILIWHEIVNDTVGGVPVAVTFCPLCNAAIVFDRRLDGRVLSFGTTGMLRKSDLVMYDRQTESWWQQFMGEAIVGKMAGARLKILPARFESVEKFTRRAPADAQILVPEDVRFRRYGHNPYLGYDSLARPFLFDGRVPDGIAPLARVVSLVEKDRAWSLDLLRRKREIVAPDGTVLRWTPGQNSALDAGYIPAGKDVGNVTATKDDEDQIYFVDFAFAFHAFRPEAPIIVD